MRVIVLGGDGYLGWPTAKNFAMAGDDVWVMDNYLRRRIATETGSEPLVSMSDLKDRTEIFHAVSGRRIEIVIGDCTDFSALSELFDKVQPEAVVHYAEQPSAPYSMIGFEEAQQTLKNNLDATFNVIWAVLQHAPDCHIIKLGTMGEYGTPNIDIEEGWIEIEHNGRLDRFLYPRAAGSLYHTTKVLDTDLLWFYTRIYGLRVTDLMQGPVYGIDTAETKMDARLGSNFHYDDIFGTVVNRFLVQAVAGVPLTVYGQGDQRRGYLNLKDTLQCVDLAKKNPVDRGDMRILNQFTETFTVNELADNIQRVGEQFSLGVRVDHVDNPRKEKEDHYYNPCHSGLLDLGLKPHPMTDDIVAEMLETVVHYGNQIDKSIIQPRVAWSHAG